MGSVPEDVLNGRVAALAAEVRRADAMVATGEPEGVHDLRVALRRTRSLLRSFRPLLDAGSRAEAERLRDECRWAGGELGPARDAEVMHERLGVLLGDQPVELVLGGVAARLADRAREDARAGRERIGHRRADARYGRILDDLDALAARAPFGEVDEAAVHKRLRREWRRLRRRAAAAEGTVGTPAAEAALHETRKTAKRTRYAVEAVLPLLDGKAAAAAALAEEVQDALGAHRDTLLTRALLRELAVQAHLAGDNGFTFGRLHALEEARGDAELAAYRRLRPALDRKQHRRAISTGT